MVRGSRSTINAHIFFLNCNLITQSMEHGFRSANYGNIILTVESVLNVHFKKVLILVF